MFPNLGRPSSCRRAEVAHLPALPRGLAPDFRPARCLTRRHQSASARRRFRATTAHSSGRLPSMRSSTLHRGSTRAFAFNRSRALAKHPCREEEPAPARHEQTRWLSHECELLELVRWTRLRWTRRSRKPAHHRYRASDTRASAGIRSTRKTRLINFYRPTTSNEHPIGSVTCPCASVDDLRVSGSLRAERAFQRHSSRRCARTPADRSPSNVPRARVRLTTHQELR